MLLWGLLALAKDVILDSKGAELSYSLRVYIPGRYNARLCLFLLTSLSPHFVPSAGGAILLLQDLPSRVQKRELQLDCGKIPINNYGLVNNTHLVYCLVYRCILSKFFVKRTGICSSRDLCHGFFCYSRFCVSGPGSLALTFSRCKPDSTLEAFGRLSLCWLSTLVRERIFP